MSLDKSVNHNKEKRKKYRGSKVIDCTCRNHGSCNYCRDSRTYNTKRNEVEPICDCDICHDTGCDWCGES